MMVHLSAYRASFTDTIPLSSLKQIEARGGHLYYRCPCGGTDHFASRACDYDTGLSVTASPVLHCYFTGQKWMIESDVSGIIRREEEQFVALLDRFAGQGMVGKRVTAAEAFRLRTEQGMPVELLDVDDIEQYDRLMDDHHRKSRNKP
jgi:hypothetical protein